MISLASNNIMLSLFNQGRKNLDELCENVERLTSGARVNHGADDPSGLGIAKGIESQIRGLFAASHNIQDGISLINLADSALEETQDILMRMRDIFVKMANEAPLNYQEGQDPNDIITSDQRKLFDEVVQLAEELKRSVAGVEKTPFVSGSEAAVKFNGKSIFDGTFEEEKNQLLQIGPDNGQNFTVKLVISSMAALVDTLETEQFPGDYTRGDFLAYARQHIDEIDSDLEIVSSIRSRLGAQCASLNVNLNEISCQTTNLSEYKSNIMDVNMASQYAKFTKAKIIDSLTTSIAPQVNAEVLLVSPLLQTITSNTSEISSITGSGQVTESAA